MIKKFFLLLTAAFFYLQSASAGVLSREMGTGQPGFWLGSSFSVSATNTDVNAAYVAGVSGTALGLRFNSPVVQSSGTLTAYVYLAANTGSPTSVEMDVLSGPAGLDDPQRPSTTTVLGSTTVDLSVTAPPNWSTFTITGISLSSSTTYWLNIINTTPTPASNFPSFANRRLNGQIPSVRISGWLTTAGYTVDPTGQGSIGTGGAEFPFVLKFDDGTIMGNPYVLSVAHASNTNDRGVRYRFTTGVKVYGIMCVGGNATNSTNLKVYQGSTLVANLKFDLSSKINPSTQPFLFGTPISLAANTDYDFVFTGITSATTTFGYVSANTSSTDILSATFSGESYVEGTTPGSYNVTPNAVGGMLLLFDSFVPSAGAAGTSARISIGQ